MIPRAMTTAARVGAAVGAGASTGSGTSFCLDLPRSNELRSQGSFDVLPGHGRTASETKAADPLGASRKEEDDGWLLAEHIPAPVDLVEVHSALEDVVACGCHGGSILLMADVRSSATSDDESVESFSADTHMATGMPRTAHGGGVAVPGQLSAMVNDVLSDPAALSAMYDALRSSPAFNELMRRGPACLPPPPPTRLYASPGTAASLSMREEREGGFLGLEAVLGALADGLDALGRALGGFFGGVGNKLRRGLLRGTKFGLPNGPSDGDAWLGAVTSLAVVALAMILFKRGPGAVMRAR